MHAYVAARKFKSEQMILINLLTSLVFTTIRALVVKFIFWRSCFGGYETLYEPLYF